MSLIKNDVTDKDIENLFDNNNLEAINNESVTQQDSIIPQELDVKSDSKNKIQRPDTYAADEVHQKKLDNKKEELLLKTASQEKLLQSSGSVSRDVFNQIAKARQQAQLEEFISKQRKLPRIAATARYKLYNNEPKCTFHVYQPQHSLDGGRFLCSCKFCSQVKVFTESQWKQYELENRQYM